MLGFYIYPLPGGTEYTAADLENPDKVIELFDYCAILEGMVTKEGWDFLIDLYGYEKLFQMDKESELIWWADSLEEFIEGVKYMRDISAKVDSERAKREEDIWK